MALNVTVRHSKSDMIRMCRKTCSYLPGCRETSTRQYLTMSATAWCRDIGLDMDLACVVLRIGTSFPGPGVEAILGRAVVVSPEATAGQAGDVVDGEEARATLACSRN